MNERPTTLVHRFGQGRGMGAELMELAWLSYRCRLLGLEFVLQSSGRLEGVACANGWDDYFEPFCKYIRVPDRLATLNSHYYGFMGKAKRPIARWLLNRAINKSCLYSFDFDRVGKMVESQDPQITVTDHFVPIYRPNQALADVFSRRFKQLNLRENDYFCMHIRRGDKITEAQYASVESYAKELARLEPILRLPVCIMSDSQAAIEDLRSLLTGYEVINISETDADGYDQREFNSLPAEIRLLRSFSFLAEFEIGRRSRMFFGSNTSNVTWLMRILHINGLKGIIEVDQ